MGLEMVTHLQTSSPFTQTINSARTGRQMDQGWRPRSYNTTAATIKAAASMIIKIVERSMWSMTLARHQGSSTICQNPLAISSDSRHLLKVFRTKKGRGHWRDGHALDTFV
jgi:hypothetical protein